MKILMVLTSHDSLGDTGQKTGFWLEEFAAPYYVFLDAGAELTLASPAGGAPPLDPKSEQDDFQSAASVRFGKDVEAQRVLANTQRLGEIAADNYEAVFYPGGHGPLWDLYASSDSIALISSMYNAGKPVAAVCHAPAVLLQVKTANGSALVDGREVTGFSNSEEAAVELTDVVPYLLEDELGRLGGNYTKGNDWEPFTCVDGHLITGQNPASSVAVAEALLAQLT